MRLYWAVTAAVAGLIVVLVLVLLPVTIAAGERFACHVTHADPRLRVGVCG